MSKRKKISIIAVLTLLCLAAGAWLLLFDKEIRSNNKTAKKSQETVKGVNEIINELKSTISDTAKDTVYDWQIADRVYSHRGSAGEKEHSFEAYDAAIKAGSHNIEQDVVLSKEGTLYVSHDENAVRITGTDRYYSDMSNAEIDELSTYNGSNILKLSDVFDRYGKKVKYIIELRNSDDATIEGFQRLVEEYGLENNIVAQSFESDVLDQLEEIYPDMHKIFLCKTQDAVDKSITVDAADSVSVRVNFMNEDTAEEIRKAGKKFSAWPLDSEEEIKAAISLNADSYFTNETAKALEIERQFRKKTDGPLSSIILASDYQAESGFEKPSDTLRNVIASAISDGKNPDAAILCGDYSNDRTLHDYQIAADDSISEIKEVIRDEAPMVSSENMIFVQGNHDALTDAISKSGLHEYNNYMVYVLNTENDFPWRQGTVGGNKDNVAKAAENLRKCLDDLISKGETRPLIVAAHVPLHFTARTSYSHSTGDNLYSGILFDVLNEGAKSLDVVFLYGHNHSKGWDCYLGGGSVYRKPGDGILIPEYDDGESKTDKYREEKLNFTYMNAGYVGYYMNCATSEYSGDYESTYSAADEDLTCSVLDIFDDRIVITRYDSEAVHPIGANGEANPYKGGIDTKLIGEEHYGKQTGSPVIIERGNGNQMNRMQDAA